MDVAEGPRLTFEVSGAHAGPPVLLLRPLHEPIPGLAAFRAALASRARVIDLDGALPPDPGCAAPSSTARSLGRSALAVLDQLGVRRTHVLGLAKGAMAATWLTIDAPDRVARVCFIVAPATSRALLRVHRPCAPVLFLVGDREETPEEVLLRALTDSAAEGRSAEDIARGLDAPSPTDLADERAAPVFRPLPEAAEPPIWEGRARAQHVTGGGHLLPVFQADPDRTLAAAHRALRFFLDAEAVTLRVRDR
ncbi:MAG: hypothetical protein U0441_13530 [Polyangiaceae bacterium]